MKTVTLDGKTIGSREELHSLLARELNFPAWYGGNLDALFDCLTGVTEEVTIDLCHRADLMDTLGEYGARAVRVLQSAARENTHIKCLFSD